jgi:hypothetical protein
MAVLLTLALVWGLVMALFLLDGIEHANHRVPT